MSEFNRYGVKIEKLKLKDIEILRSWRNDPKIAKLMLSQNGTHITKEEQLKWFNSIQNQPNSLYYMAFVDDIAIGYFCFQQINWQDCTAVPGEIMVIPKQFDEARITLGAYCAIYDMAFEILGFKQLKAYCKLENKRAIRMAKILNFKSTHTDNQCIYFELYKDDYYQMRDSLIYKLGLAREFAKNELNKSSNDERPAPASKSAKASPRANSWGRGRATRFKKRNYQNAKRNNI